MDKYEFKLRLEEINGLIQQRRYDEAADIADGIDWNHVGNADTLRQVSEVYKAVGDYDRSRSVMAIARKRQPDNPAIIYSLCELTIYLYGRDGLQDDLTDSLQMMQEYQTLQPDSPKRLILQYKMYGVSGASISEKIAVLEQLKNENFTARWGYELARCYAQAGEQTQAAELAREVSEIFGGRYGDRALELAQSLEEASGSEKGLQAGQTLTQSMAQPERVKEGRPSQSRIEETATGEAGPAERDFPTQEDRGAGFTGEKPREEEPSEEIFREEAPGSEHREEPFGEENTDMQTGRQASIDEVMAEWEKIRSDIRRANDEKRAQRILEDTGSLLNSFDETARHGLLEDIEKGVARQRRQVRSGAYRVSRELYDNAVSEPVGADSVDRYADSYDRNSYSRGEGPARRDYGGYDRTEGYEERPVRRYDEEGYEERSVRRYDEEGYEERPVRRYVEEGAKERPARRYDGEEYKEQPAGDHREEPAAEHDAGSQRQATGQDEKPAAPEEPVQQEIGSSLQGADDVPVSNEDDDVRIYGRETADDARTRRWNSEEIHRSVSRGTRYREDARGKKRVVMAEESGEEAPNQENRESSYDDETLVEEPAAPEEAAVDHRAEERSQEPAAAEQNPAEDLLGKPDREQETEPAPRPRRRVRRMSAGEEPYGPLGEDGAAPVRKEEPKTQEESEPSARQRMQARAPQPSRNPSAAAEKSEESLAGKRELTREERRLFGPFCRMTENVNQLTDALDQISLASSTGNLLILGNEATADRVARGILEIVRHSDSNFTGRIARATGESLNKLDAGGFARTFAKLESGALIVTRAADIAPKTLERMHVELEKEHGVILILTDSNKRMEQFRKENGQYLESFTALINIRPLDDKALVAYARDYALSQDYSIDEFGQLALAQRISSMQTPTHHVTLKEVRDLVDEAISYASRKNPGTVMEVLSRKRRDEDNRIILHEKDFTHY